MTMDDRAIFDAIRARKGAPLTQSDVDAINGVMYPDAGLTLSAEGEALIHQWESLRLTAYADPGSKDGKPITNGWGTTVDEDGGPISLGARWDREKADRLWRRDVAAKIAAVKRLVEGRPTTQSQFDALVSLAYNIGETALAKSTLLKKHNAGDYAGAKAQFAAWVNNDGKRLQGLVNRRAAEAKLYGRP